MHWATKNKNNYRPNHRAQNEAYNHKKNYFKDICDGAPSFINMFDFNKFKFIFSSNDLDICKMCILGVNKLYSLNQSKKQD